MADTDTDTRTWWQRTLDTSVDALEDHVFDPLDEHTSRWRRVRAYRVASTARWHAEQHAVRCVDSHARAERLRAWAAAEEAAGHARAGLHTDCPSTCCTPLVRLYRDRAELLRAVAVTEQQGSQLDDIPVWMRRLAGDQFAAMARTWSPRRKSESAAVLVRQLTPEIGRAAKPIRQLYPSRKGLTVSWGELEYYAVRCDGQLPDGQCDRALGTDPCSPDVPVAYDERGVLRQQPVLWTWPPAELSAEWLRQLGWLQTRDRRTLCPDHVAELEAAAAAELIGLGDGFP